MRLSLLWIFLNWLTKICFIYIILQWYFPELGTSLFEIAQSFFALERTLILGAMALNTKKSEERQANWQNQILSGPLMSDIRIKEHRKMDDKSIKMHDLYIF